MAPEDLAREVALAEYTVLKSEAQTRITSQMTLVGFGLTAAAALSAVALSGSGNSDTQPDRLLFLLIVPLIVNGLGMYVIQHNIARSRVTSYIRDVLWPVIAGGTPVAGIDHYIATTMHPSRRRFNDIAVTASNVACFPTSDVLALILSRNVAFESPFTIAVWVFDVIFSIGLLVAGTLSALDHGRAAHEPLAPWR